MKKYLLLLLLLCSPLVALPIGNPMDATLYSNGLFCGDCYEESYCDPCDPCFNWCDAWNFRIGFYGDYVFNRHMELKNRDGAKIDDFELFTNALYLAVNVCDRLDVFATLGATSLNLKSNPGVWNNAIRTALFELQTETDFSWSVGGRLTLWSCDCFFFGLEGQYFYTKPDLHYAVASNNVLAYPSNISLKYSEWQVGLGVSYLVRVGCSGVSAIPYMGLKWAGSCGDFNNGLISTDITMLDIENSKLWGYGIGMTLLFCDALSMTVEGRFGDEKALYVNGQFRF
ncbi:MAG: Major outer membrane porin [Chlamydiales bacterium]|nr:Major outer membrane porin [Chlamydiales bacterium]